MTDPNGAQYLKWDVLRLGGVTPTRRLGVTVLIVGAPGYGRVKGVQSAYS